MQIRSRLSLGAEFAVATLLAGCCGAALSQYAGPAMSSSAHGTVPASAVDVNYGDITILPGDVLAIQTYGAPELTTTGLTPTSPLLGIAPVVAGIKVGPSGEVVLPYLGKVKLSGMTTSEAAIYLAKALKDGGFFVDPQITVQLVDSPTRVITVIGEVSKPAPIPAFGQVRLLDAISAAGGFTELASHTITIHRRDVQDPIIVALGSNPNRASASNIPLLPGDTIIVPKVGDVYVVGQVNRQGQYPLSSNLPVTVMRAISMSGGVKYGAALSKVAIIRTSSEGQTTKYIFDLKRLMDGKMADITLASNDVLFVPSNTFKATVAAGGAAVAAQALYGAAYTASLVK